MMKRHEITPALLRRLLKYDPETGVLVWLEREPSMFQDKRRTAAHTCALWNSKHAGKVATGADFDGYRMIGIYGVRFGSHVVAWAIHHGAWPQGHIDHINHDRADNRMANLRDVSHRQNCKNRSLNKNNKSGACGVYWRSKREAWHASIKHNGQQIHLGVFLSFESADAARKAAEKRYGYHENHGQPPNKLNELLEQRA